MKKILFLLMLLLAFFGLVACNGSNNEGEFPNLKEGDLIELSASEMVELFTNLEYSTSDQESMRFSIEGAFKVTQVYDGWNYESTTDVEAEFDFVFYTLISPLVEDARIHLEGSVDFTSVDMTVYDDPQVESETYTTSVVGNGGVYFYNQYLYLNSNLEVDIDDEEESAVFKQKVSEMVTQEMWDETYSEDMIDEYENMVPQEFLDMLEDGDIEGLMDAIPNLKVYRDGQTYSIAFEIDKQGILDSIEDLIRELAVVVENMGENPPTEQEIQDVIDETTEAINDEIDELSVKFVISIKENKIVKIAADVLFESTDGNIKIDILYVIDFNVELPAFPTDLDDYEEVDYPGEGYFD